MTHIGDFLGVQGRLSDLITAPDYLSTNSEVRSIDCKPNILAIVHIYPFNILDFFGLICDDYMIPSTNNLQLLIEEIETDPYRVFWGDPFPIAPALLF